MPAPITRYARGGDVHLAYQVVGEGPRDLVFALDWASHLEVLWEQPFVQDWIDDVAAVMDAAGSLRASLVAHGHASQMALMAAATHPDRIESLVLMTGFARFSRTDDYPAGIPAEAGEQLLGQVADTWGRGTMAALLGPRSRPTPA